MELGKLDVKNWRGVPQASIDFAPGITIVGGPNECGKTSLRAALHAALVLPTGVRNEGKLLETYRTWETKLYPSVKLQFMHEGKTIDVEKEFLRKKDWSSLRVDGKLIAQDGEVQRTINGILGDNLDWIEILWGKQGDVSFDRGAPDSIKGRLAKAAQDTVIPQVAQLKDSIEEEYSKYWTPQGAKPNKRFQEHRTVVFDAEAKVRDLEKKIVDANQRASALDTQTVELAAEKQKLEQVEKDWAYGQKSLGAWQVFERAQMELNIAEQNVVSMETWRTTWGSLLGAVGKLLPDCRDWLLATEKLKAAIGTEPSSESLDALRVNLNYLELAITKEKRDAIEKILVPSDAELKELEHTEDVLRNIEASLNAVAFRAEIQAEKVLQIEITRDGGEKEVRALNAEESSEWQAQQNFHLSIPGVAALRVTSGDPQIAKSVEERAVLRTQFADALKKWQAANLAELRARLSERDILKKQLPSVDPKLYVAQRAKVSEADELDRMPLLEKERMVQTLANEIQISEGNLKTAQAEYMQSMRSYQDLLSKTRMPELKASLINLQAHCVAAPLDAVKSLEIPTTIEKDASNDVETQASLLDESAVSAIGNILGSAKTHDEPLTKLISEKRESLEKQRTELVKPEGDPITPESLEQKEREKSELAAKVHAFETSINQTLGEIKAQGNLHAQVVESEESLARSQAELARVEADAHAIKELRLAFESARQKLQEDVVAPLQTRVTQALDKVTGGFYKGVAFDPSLKVSGVHAGVATSVVLDEISFGTREQLSFLTRLCLAQLLATEACRQVVVLDDNLVHTDSARMLTACQLLESASAQIQVVVFTCHPERYVSLSSASFIELAAREN